MSRCLAETMPSVTEPPSPNGLPIASTQSPTFSLVDEPNGTATSGFLPGVTFSTARSALASRPTSVAVSFEPSAKLAMISSAPSMT